MKVIEFDEPLVHGRVAYDRLAKLQSEVFSCNEDSILHIINNSNNNYARHFLFILATMISVTQENNRNMKIFLPSNIMEHLQDMDITDYFNKNEKQQRFDVLKTGEDVFSASWKLVKSLPIKMSDKFTEHMISVFLEIYNNCLGHSGKKYLVHGRYPINKGRKKIFASWYDAGIGIPTNVNNYFKKNGMKESNDTVALKWAMQSGNTTAGNGKSRGLGFDFIKNFVRLNSGRLTVCSGQALYVYKDQKEQYYKLQDKFIGTLFELTINPVDNNTIYILKGEMK